MVRLGEDIYFKKIDNFFTDSELGFLKKYCDRKLRRCDFYNGPDEWASQPAWRDDDVMSSFLETKMSLVEKQSNLKLFPTYAFWRYYVFGGKLPQHTDRPACEVSITACMKKLSDWPIIIGNTSFELNEGEAVLYSGCAVSHSRPGIYKGEGLAQVFLHYVDADGFFQHHKYDNFFRQYGLKYSLEDRKILEKIKYNYETSLYNPK